MKIVAFVPVKFNNERVPGKNTKCFDDGTPLLTLFLKTLVQVPEIDEIYVFCSSDEVQGYLIPGVSYLKRPKDLDTKEASPQDIITAFMNNVYADIYLACHCTSPFVKIDRFSECINKVAFEGYDSAFTGERVQKLMWYDGAPLNFDAENVPRTQDLPIYYNEVSAVYVFHRETFESLQRRIGLHPFICEVSGYECIDIDYPEDFEIANAVYMGIIRRGELL